MFQNLPLELLTETIGYVSLHCHERELRQLKIFEPDSPAISPSSVMSCLKDRVLRSHTVPLSQSGVRFSIPYSRL